MSAAVFSGQQMNEQIIRRGENRFASLSVCVFNCWLRSLITVSENSITEAIVGYEMEAVEEEEEAVLVKLRKRADGIGKT